MTPMNQTTLEVQTFTRALQCHRPRTQSRIASVIEDAVLDFCITFASYLLYVTKKMSTTYLPFWWG